MKKSVLFLLFLSVFGAKTVLGDSHASENADQIKKFENAVKFVREKKYFEAVKEFELLATSGLPEAQFNLAILNLNGLGTPPHLLVFVTTILARPYIHFDCTHSCTRVRQK